MPRHSSGQIAKLQLNTLNFSGQANAHARFQNPSVRKVTPRERKKKRKNAVNSGQLV